MPSADSVAHPALPNRINPSAPGCVTRDDTFHRHSEVTYCASNTQFARPTPVDRARCRSSPPTAPTAPSCPKRFAHGRLRRWLCRREPVVTALIESEERGRDLANLANLDRRQAVPGAGRGQAALAAHQRLPAPRLPAAWRACGILVMAPGTLACPCMRESEPMAQAFPFPRSSARMR